MSEQVHTTEQLDLQELKEEIIRKVMMLPDKDVTEMLEFVKALTFVGGVHVLRNALAHKGQLSQEVLCIGAAVIRGLPQI